MKITLTKRDVELLVPEIYGVVDQLPNKIFGYSNKKVKRFLKKLTTEEVIESAEVKNHISLRSDAKKVTICIPEEVLDTYRFFPQSPFHTVIYDIVDEKLPGKHRGLILMVLSLLASDIVFNTNSRRYQKTVTAIEMWRNSPDVYMELAQRMFTDFQKETNVHKEPERFVTINMHKPESVFGDVPMDLKVTLHDNSDEVELLIQATFICEEGQEDSLVLDPEGFGEMCKDNVSFANKEFDCCRFWDGFDPESVDRTGNVLTAKIAGYAAPQGDDPWADYTELAWKALAELVGERLIDGIETAESLYCPAEMNCLNGDGTPFIWQVEDEKIRITSTMSRQAHDPTTKGESIYCLHLNVEALSENGKWSRQFIEKDSDTAIEGYTTFLMGVAHHDYPGTSISPYEYTVYELEKNRFSCDFYFGIQSDVSTDYRNDVCITIASCGLGELKDSLALYVEEEWIVRTPITGLRKPITGITEEEKEALTEETLPEHEFENDIDAQIIQLTDEKGKDDLHFDCNIRLFYPENHRGPKSNTEAAIKNYYLKKLLRIKTRFMEEVLNPIGEEQNAAIIIGRTRMTGNGDPFYSFSFSIDIGSLKAKMKAADKDALIQKIYETKKGLEQITSEIYN